ncbi:MAG: extracellular solute-binding protein [Candidatus Levybacteria bacterium]|nr:extracellular solute-binding protein [Candidatus Levybacteria bacterium]
MDENTVFNKNQSDQPPTGDPPPALDANAAAPQAEPVPSDPSLTTDPPQADQPVEPVIDPATGLPVDDQTETGDALPPPPNVGFLGGGLIKKIIIGVGVLIFLIAMVVLFMPKGQSSEQVKLQWWGLWEESNAVQGLIADFEKDNPNIDVEYQKRAPQEYRERLIARIENNSGPDIFRYHNTWRPMLGKNLLPLSSDVISPEDFQKAYYPIVQKDLVTSGAIYGIPLGVDSLALFINPELFEAAGVQVPNNWEDFVKVSKQLTVKGPDGKIQTAGAALGTYDNVAHAPDIISLLFLQQSIPMEKFSEYKKQQAVALEFYTSFALGNSNVWDETLDNSTLAFSRGKLAMYFGYSWDVFAIQKLNKDLAFKVYPVPANQNKKTTVASYWVEGVSAKSPNQKEALEFMKYLAQKETLEKFYTETAKTRAFGELYPRKDLRESLREEPLAYPFLSQMDDVSSSMFSSDTHDGDTGMNTLLNTYLGTAIRSIVNDSDAPDKVVETLNSGVAQVNKKYEVKKKK